MGSSWYNAAMKVGELGEFGLIERLARRVAEQMPAGPQGDSGFALLLGIGDDAAAWRTGEGTELCTTDTMVQGVHFALETATWRDVGWKALAVNLSDVAAMGGAPLYAVVTLGLPEETEVASVDALYDGLLDCGSQYNTAIVGGDIVRSPVTFITIALTGMTSGPVLSRSAARPGDQIAVTGCLGGSGAGLVMFRRGLHLAPSEAESLKEAHMRPRPRLTEGQVLLAGGVRSAMDISDGLVDDLRKLCQASGVAARLQAESLPIHPAVCHAFPQEALDLALGGGEEYELLFTAPREVLEGLVTRLPSGATVIGEVLAGSPGQVTVLDKEGQALDLATAGWDHFRG